MIFCRKYISDMTKSPILDRQIDLNRVFLEGADVALLDPEIARLARARLETQAYTEDLLRPGVANGTFKRDRLPFPFSRVVGELEAQLEPVSAIFGREACKLDLSLQRITEFGCLDWQQNQRRQAWVGFTLAFPEPGWRGTDGGIWELAKASLRPDGSINFLEVSQVHPMNHREGLLIVYNPSSLAFRHWLSPVEGNKTLYLVQGTLGGLS